jgi:hypothetical protein
MGCNKWQLEDVQKPQKKQLVVARFQGKSKALFPAVYRPLRAEHQNAAAVAVITEGARTGTRKRYSDSNLRESTTK